MKSAPNIKMRGTAISTPRTMAIIRRDAADRSENFHSISATSNAIGAKAALRDDQINPIA